jgi:NET1-associated nuclear protein 1 (U3 small nucleolar RNA-associated protein 17)
MTYNTSIQVFSAADSLLVRRIPITTIDARETTGSSPATIVAARQSKKDSDFVWVATSDGHVYHVNWTQQSRALESFKTTSGTAKAMAVASVTISQIEEDVLVVVESDKPTRMDLVAYHGLTSSTPASKNLVSVKKPGNGLQVIEASEDGRALVGALNDRVILGSLSQVEINKFDDIEYDFYSFDAPDLITTVDMRVHIKNPQGGKKSRQIEPERVVDILLGGARGGIYLYQDAVNRLQSASKSNPERLVMQAQKYHWHRRAVHAVKWSRDGKPPILRALR